jgi:hypothetical protein
VDRRSAAKTAAPKGSAMIAALSLLHPGSVSIASCASCCTRAGARRRGSQVRVEFRRALALRSQIRRAGWFN